MFLNNKLRKSKNGTLQNLKMNKTKIVTDQDRERDFLIPVFEKKT